MPELRFLAIGDTSRRPHCPLPSCKSQSIIFTMQHMPLLRSEQPPIRTPAPKKIPPAGGASCNAAAWRTCSRRGLDACLRPNMKRGNQNAAPPNAEHGKTRQAAWEWVGWDLVGFGLQSRPSREELHEVPRDSVELPNCRELLNYILPWHLFFPDPKRVVLQLRTIKSRRRATLSRQHAAHQGSHSGNRRHRGLLPAPRHRAGAASCVCDPRLCVVSRSAAVALSTASRIPCTCGRTEWMCQGGERAGAERLIEAILWLPCKAVGWEDPRAGRPHCARAGRPEHRSSGLGEIARAGAERERTRTNLRRGEISCRVQGAGCRVQGAGHRVVFFQGQT